MMKFEILAGDFPVDATFTHSAVDLPELRFNNSNKELVRIELYNLVERVEMLTEENKKKILGSVGWGVTGMIVGGLVAAPVALAAGIAGILKGGNKKEITFACYLKDGKKFMAVADSKIYTELSALAF